jgi:RNA polymerase sigma-32 factor
MQSRDRSEQRSGADAQREREEGVGASNDGADAFEAELVDAGELDAANAEVVQDEDTGRDALVRRPIARTRGAGAGPLARYDPLQAYMRDVQRHPLLTPAEEHEAAVKYYEHGDVDAAAKLVTANLRLVVKIAYEYRRAHKHIPDLIQEGSIGLMQAVKKYDPYKGVKLSTYAAWWIRAYILRFILNNARLVKLGTTQAQRKLFFNLRKERARLSAMGIEPTPETIAKRLNVPAEDVVQMERRLSSGDQSLDTPLRNTDEANAPSRMELLVEDSGRVDDALADAQVNSLIGDKIRAFGETLGGKDARIFNSRMLAEEPRTLQELGDEFGVSRERVRQLEKRLQNRLKDYLDSELGEDVIGGN